MRLRAIGIIHSQFKNQQEVPKQGSLSKEEATIEVFDEYKMGLREIEEFSHLGAGFEVAMSDLELRGAGNILGKEQHGFVWMVGFDLYCRLLKKEIEYLKEAFRFDTG